MPPKKPKQQPMKIKTSVETPTTNPVSRWFKKAKKAAAEAFVAVSKPLES